MCQIDLNGFARQEGETLPLDCAPDLSSADPAFSDVSVRGMIRNVAGVMTLKATVKGTCVLPCDRCLSDTVLPLTAELNTVITLSDSKDESVTVEDGRVDLEKTAFDALVLALPLKILCREDCRGLCPVCGKNRNEGDCGCQQ